MPKHAGQAQNILVRILISGKIQFENVVENIIASSFSRLAVDVYL